ncbi:distal membrane-arm assembly complex protein 2 isoform X1 [Trachemys scripta elegans]|uniref:distal membrane-arm assembly complex protein 2 isoform X1 n=1 Tax=Trachemys scripta elegans TaxID=31138 RepID=UPI001553BF48|nr:distal membrane-arm assembly complex protein 2 isoform X1 [Trachemys scripta elegans]
MSRFHRCDAAVFIARARPREADPSAGSPPARPSPRPPRVTQLQQCRALARHPYGSAASPDPSKGGILQYLCNRFYDIEYLVSWSATLRYRNLRRKNAYCGYIKSIYGDNAAAAYFVLSHRGRVRFQGQETWFCVDQRGNFSYDFVELQDVPVVAIDLAGSVLNYDGLDNLVKLTALKSLDLSRCPHVDDWTLTRLQVFKDSLEELSLAGCPQVTERGLACLHLLENLRRLDLSHLPSVPTPGLIRILVEEMLPRCEVVGLAPAAGAQTSRDGREEPGVPSGDRRAGEIPA